MYMDDRSKERLEQLLEKSPESLTEEEIRFIRARRLYLKKYQLEEYGELLNQTSKKETVKKHGKTRKTN